MNPEVMKQIEDAFSQAQALEKILVEIAPAIAIAHEWADWIPYPDSPKAEWDRYRLANTLVELAEALSKEQERG